MKPVICICVLLTVTAPALVSATEDSTASLGSSETLRSRLHFAYSVTAPTENAGGALHSDATMLPKFEVREKPLNLTSRDVQTPSAILAEAKARYLDPVYQKTGGQLMAVIEILANPLGGWHPNEATALTFYAQDERLRRMKEDNELIEVYRFENPGKFKELRQLLYDTYQHEPDRRPGVMQRR